MTLRQRLFAYDFVVVVVLCCSSIHIHCKNLLRSHLGNCGHYSYFQSHIALGRRTETCDDYLRLDRLAIRFIYAVEEEKITNAGIYQSINFA